MRLWFRLMFALGAYLFAQGASALPTPASIASSIGSSIVPVLTLAPASAPVEVHPDSPRAALSEFYKACEDANYAEAAAFLEVRTNAERERGSELASRLRFVLDKRLWVQPDELAHEKPSPEKKAAPEELGIVSDRQGRKIPIRLTWSGPRSRWLFAYDTVKHVDRLFNEIDENWTRRFFPQVLTRRGPQKFEYWQWLAVPFILGAAWLIGLMVRPFARGVISFAGAKRPEVAKSAKRLAPSVGFVVSIGSADLLFAQLRLYEPAQDFVDRWLLALFWLVVFHTIWRVARTVLDVVGGSEWAAHRPSARSFLPFASRAFGAFVIFIGLASVLSSLGYNVTGLLTGLGIGGVAVALAAQKTVENLFGSFSLSVDQPFRVGDTILVDGTTGTVEGIGLRSTRIRTLDRTLVTFPNGKLADMKVETISYRDRMRSTQIIKLSPKSDPARVDALVKKMRATLASWKDVIADGTTVRVRVITEAATELEVIVSFATTDANEFNERQQALIFELARAIESGGLELGAPRPAPAV